MELIRTGCPSSDSASAVYSAVTFRVSAETVEPSTELVGKAGIVDTLAACRRPSVSCASRGGVSPARAARGPFRLAHRRPFLLRDMLHSCGRKCMRSSRVLGHVRVPPPFPE